METTQENADMDTELAPQAPRLPAIQFSREQIELIKRTIAVDHTDDELSLFLNFCKAKRLDPFAREIYSIKRKGKATIQMGIDGLRARGEDTGNYAGQETFWCGPDGEWVDVWLAKEPPVASKVHIYRKDSDRAFTGIAKWDEYKPDEDFMWKKMPANQLAKCAEALGLRKAFPRTLGGIYVNEELQAVDRKEKFPPLPERAAETVAYKPAAAEPANVNKKTGEITDDPNDSVEDPPPQRRTIEGKKMPAKYPGSCVECHKPITVGMPIVYVGEGADKGGYHVACVNG